MQAKGRRHSSSQLIGCSVTTRKRRRGGATKQLMECVARVCLYTKEVGAGEALCVVLKDPSAFSRGKRRRGKSDLIEYKKCSRLNQKSRSDNNGNLAYTILVIGVRFWNLLYTKNFQRFPFSEGGQKLKTGYVVTLSVL